jgi:hypothetical protein
MDFSPSNPLRFGGSQKVISDGSAWPSEISFISDD